MSKDDEKCHSEVIVAGQVSRSVSKDKGKCHGQVSKQWRVVEKVRITVERQVVETTITVEIKLSQSTQNRA